jgi:phosphomannomutase
MTEQIKFGTDGWRAIIAEDFTFANVERVSYAIGHYIKDTYAHWCPCQFACADWL